MRSCVRRSPMVRCGEHQHGDDPAQPWQDVSGGPSLCRATLRRNGSMRPHPVRVQGLIVQLCRAKSMPILQGYTSLLYDESGSRERLRACASRDQGRVVSVASLRWAIRGMRQSEMTCFSLACSMAERATSRGTGCLTGILRHTNGAEGALRACYTGMLWSTA